MIEAMGAFVGEELLGAQVRGENRERMGNRDPANAPQGLYPCAGDDRWIAISVTSNQEWRALAALADLGSELTALIREDRHARHEELDTLIKATIAGGGVIPHIHKSLINKSSKKSG